MYCVYRENVYNRRHFNVYTEKYTLDMVVAWKSRTESGRQEMVGRNLSTFPPTLNNSIISPETLTRI